MKTHFFPTLKTKRGANPSGFALVATLMLMLLLGILAIGMLSLSSISLRGASQDSAMSEARSNARMALMLAIGELQKQMGPDQRISANGSILGDSSVRHPHWMGSWDSWKAGSTSEGSPSGASDEQTIIGTTRTGMCPTYVDRSKHFRKWIVSTDAATATNPRAPLDAVVQGYIRPNGSATEVRLVASGTLGTEADPSQHVHVGLLKSLTGRYAYWVGDESQKARISGDPYVGNSSLTAADRMFRMQAPGSTGTTRLPGLENIGDADQPALEFGVTLPTVNLIGNAAKDVSHSFHHITTQSLGVFADVREGGLKRDLSTILERPIDPEEVFSLSRTGNTDPLSVDSFLRATGMQADGNDHLLYSFDQTHAAGRKSSKPATGQATVPIEDLAAYYQLYDSKRSGWRKGVEYQSPMMSNGIQITSPDYGYTFATGENDKFLREYAAMFRNIIPVKVEYALGYIAIPRPQSAIDADKAGYPSAVPPIPPNPDPDTHSLRVGVSPSITLWNPSNVPLVFNHTDGKKFSHMLRCFPFKVDIQYVKNDADPATVPKRGIVSSFTNSISGFDGDVFSMFFGSTRSLRFEPGEFKVFSFAFSSAETAAIPTREFDFTGSSSAEVFNPAYEGIPGWNPNKYLLGKLSPEVLTFKSSDTIAARVHSDVYANLPIHFNMMQQSRTTYTPGYPTAWHYRQYQVSSLFGGNGTGYMNKPFNLLAFPKGVPIIEIPKRSGSNLIANINVPGNATDDEPEPFLYLGMKAATETAESASIAGVGMGRNVPGRPFLHSSPIFPQFVSSAGGLPANVFNINDYYNHSWNCWIRGVNSVFDAASYVQISNGDSGYHGGGSSPENGTTHLVQQHLPLVPPISIAALSDAHLGGFSLATEPPAENWSALGHNPWSYDSYERVTATGFAGLAPHMLQAVGNSCAHPLIKADAVSDTWRRLFMQGGWNQAAYPFPFVDHSYLVNKALWDDYFFSSITPAPYDISAFEGQTRTVEETARGFFFNGKNLPNARMVPNTAGLDESGLSALFTTYSQFKGGFADKIAAHLMVKGAFNVNSTSVTAWKALFSSLRGKPVAYLDSDKAVNGTTNIETGYTTGVPVGGGFLPNGKPYTGSPTAPNEPRQWNSWRELTDKEIDELAAAMVTQVRLRGPFLSLSEFINRRLDIANKPLSLKGALQAALDDPSVSINAGFRTNARTISATEAAVMSPKFPEALVGPVAYGSAAYVDQADLLRNLAEQLTPRGDTFVIRTYGDSLDANGKVMARAWCEAVVQRLPEYIDGADEPQVKQADLTSATNKVFGRKLCVIQFRWLNENEI